MVQDLIINNYQQAQPSKNRPTQKFKEVTPRNVKSKGSIRLKTKSGYVRSDFEGRLPQGHEIAYGPSFEKDQINYCLVLVKCQFQLDTKKT